MDNSDWLIEKTRHLVGALAGIAEYVNTIPDYREADELGRPTREAILIGELHNALHEATKLLAYTSNADWGSRDRDSVMRYGQKGYQHLCRRYGLYGPEEQFPLPFVVTDNTSLSEAKDPIGSTNDLEAHWTFDTFDTQRPLCGSVIWRNETVEEEQQRISLTNALEQTSHYALQPDGWLLISGPHGVGKSHLAGAIVQRTKEAGRVSLYVSIPDLWARYSSAEDTLWQAEQSLLESDELLVFDNLDMGYHLRGDKYLEQILRDRCRDRRPTVLVSIGGKDELPQWISHVVKEISVVASDFHSLLRRSH